MTACDGDFDIGDQVIWVATFRNDAGVLTNPTAVTFQVQKPDGVEMAAVSTPNAAITNPSVGVWEYLQPTALDQAGTWWARARGTAGLLAADEISRTVNSSVFATP